MPNKHRKNNKGFSLVELLVAITILAVVMIPMLHSFITSARANAKAKKVMEATTVAQNIMEEIKSEHLTDYLNKYSFTKSIVKDASGHNVTDINGENIYTYSKKMISVSAAPEANTVSAAALSVNGRDFRAEVTLDPQNYTATTTPAPGSARTDYNTILYSKLSSLSKSSNAFYIQKDEQETEAAKSIDPMAYEDVKDAMNRTITIDIEHNSSSKITKVYATVEYSDGRLGKTEVIKPINRQKIYSNADDPDKMTLSNVFVIFYPMYNSTSKVDPKERIIINNKDNYKVGVFLVKQTLRDASAANRGNYLAELQVNEGTRSSLADANGKPDVITSVATNLCMDNTPTNKEINVSYDTENHVSLPTLILPKDMLDMKDLTKADAEPRIYDVTIKVYDKKDTSYAKVLTTMEGTTIQ